MKITIEELRQRYEKVERSFASVQLEGANLRGMIFEDASFIGINTKLAAFYYADLRNTDLSNANLECVEFGKWHLN
ncbi:pentapeptide repeat-containing protein [Nostoc sp. MS1]|uniref:pentapeptide repeat-containing protein n=1 Tax=Nostoc sp. MS1 TaxID=2764711 RepID=UPI001CC5FA73|nr:pentapeptide repeat-containing protein [Nostoc sp. MS1]BCL39283.1 hypothetical protein NSMS1_57300 [Nostoc sp. MS1]